MVLNSREKQWALILSIFFHALLIALFLLLKVKWHFRTSEFTEVAFVTERGSSLRPDSPLSKSEELSDVNDGVQATPDVVKLPLRKMLEDEAPELRVPDDNQKISVEDKEKINRHEQSANKTMIDAPLFSASKKEDKLIASAGRKLTPEDKIMPASSAGKINAGGENMPYQIEGKVAERAVVHKVIPEYPENLQKQAVVKIGFSVLPNGQVGEMIPVIRSDPQLEKLTLDALRQWRFNPLSESEPQNIQRGVITFRYVLE